MKKLWFIMLMICTICSFTACSDNDDDPTPQNPVSNVKIPGTAEIGTEIIISGTGFASTASFTFKGTEKSADVTKAEVVSTGVTLTVPMSLTPGKYTLLLKQDGEWELGSIELTAASLPIIGLEVPAEGFTGQPVTIDGNGYNETSKVYAVNAEGSRTELTVTGYEDGLTCTLPSDLAIGIYSLVLSQNEGEWTLTEEFEVVPMKRIAKITFSCDYGEDGIWEIDAYEIEYSGKEAQKLYYHYAGIYKIPYDITINNNQVKLSTDEDNPDLEEVYYYGYMVDIALTMQNGMAQDSKIKYYDFEAYKNLNYTWSYENGYMKTYNNREYKFDASENLTDISGWTFTYDGDQKYNRPGVDIAALLYEIISSEFDMGWFYAALTGSIGQKSASLPVDMNEMKLEYKFDKDGYVEQMSFVDESDVPNLIDFIYEEVK